MQRASQAGGSLLNIYRNIHPWASLNEFVEQMTSTIAYKSEDNSLIALNKPFGIGTYTVSDLNVSPQNPDKTLNQWNLNPKYCLSDALDPLSQILKSTSKYFIIKSIDRYASGLVLITNKEMHLKNFKKSTINSKIDKRPPYGIRAITSGYPSQAKSHEFVGVELIEVDEFGDYKEPKVTKNPGSTFRTKKDKKVFQAEFIVNKVNRDISASLIELFCSSYAWDFPRCYISNETAFVLGDVRFSRRIREVLGKKTQVTPLKSSARYLDEYEPLNSTMGQVLGVQRNSQIPLMLDHHKLRLKKFNRKTKEDLVIENPYMPSHFALTCERLGLLNDTNDV